MLFLQLKSGEYLTIGEDIVIQVFSSSTVRLSVQAPRDMSVLRGELRERCGEARPPCLLGPRAEEQRNAAKPPRQPDPPPATT